MKRMLLAAVLIPGGMILFVAMAGFGWYTDKRRKRS